MNGGTPTTYTYNDADQLTSDGTSTYIYDDNGNLVSRGSDTFTWDYASRMTGATVASTTATYTYDGEDVRVAKTVASTPTTYLWDRESGLPLLVDDGSNAYLHAGGALGEISASTREDLITDALGSVRGVSDGAGALTGGADFDAYGAVRASSGSAAGFAFTGEQSDPETGFTYLRARYLDPAIGRFSAVDTVIPNAPGTQGYNPYGYVAGNPVRWVDPSGHLYKEPTIVISAGVAVGLVAISAAFNLTVDIIVCYLIEPCRRVAETIRKWTNPTDWPWPWPQPGGETGGDPGGETGGDPGAEGGDDPGPDPDDDPAPDPGTEPEPPGGGGVSNPDDDPDRGRVKCDSRYSHRHHLIPREMFRRYKQQFLNTVGAMGTLTLQHTKNIKCIPIEVHKAIHNGWGYAIRCNDYFHAWVSSFSTANGGRFPGYLNWTLRRAEAVNYYHLQPYPYTNGSWNVD